MSRSLAGSRSKSRAKARETSQAVSRIVAAPAFTIAALALAAVLTQYLRGRGISWGITAPGILFLVVGIAASVRSGRGGRPARG